MEILFKSNEKTIDSMNFKRILRLKSNEVFVNGHPPLDSEIEFIY